MTDEPRSRARRRRDTEKPAQPRHRSLAGQCLGGRCAYLVPLSFDCDGEALLVATPADSPTGRNLAATRTVRLGLGHTRDVSMIDADARDGRWLV
jgi:hypothetical protein